ncbi:uncharacterized protein LOC105185375 [Harpegnathos saltator]|uniref:Immunoglobulin domain-containing protein n=1 Tax=Harpegnathos saltator TaxID=610380 RepID=E2BQ96_HARSA|nr:uncharacterized protein LOC105185375 [Harpegnathos saltator]XP_011143112.1 uncharacterized protein LOC105185375 [Harpegnathos saltator]XP_011143113.1 uncharacterized protein LOC105185375 [Harpegnathos saltator]EFN82150.1 hypothetical protein EAI_09546 [Harpegnathos saltator]
MWLFIFFYSSLILQKSESIDDVTVKEVTAGHLAELPCLSIDDHHRFMFWQFGNNDVIGPGNSLNEKKYNYEVLTGKLMIRGVSTAESGFYKCVSRGLFDESSFKIHSVELVVKKDWEDVWETDFETNLLRGLSAVMVIVVAVAVVLLIITVKRKRSQKFFDLEESRENSPARYHPNNTLGVTSTAEVSGGVDNSALDIDFPRVFKQMQKEQAMP